MGCSHAVTSDVPATICIPTVHRLGLFRGALESAASQSFRDFEILVSVNSAESSYFQQVAGVVERVELQHPTCAIRVIRPPNFLHITDHANFMVDHAAGRYLCFLSDDDRMEASFLETLVPLLDARDDAGFAFCDFTIIDEKGVTRRDLTARDARDTHLASLEEGFIPHAALARLALWNAVMLPCSVFRRAVLDEFPFASGNEAPDRDFWLRVADAPGGLGAIYTQTPLLHYRHHHLQYTRLTRASLSDLIRALQCCRSVAGAGLILHRRELARTHAKFGKALLDEGDRLGAWRALLVALRKNPFDRRTYRFVLQAALPASALRYARRLREAGQKSMDNVRRSA